MAQVSTNREGTKKVVKSCRQDQKSKLEDISHKITEAEEFRDSKEAWVQGRLFARTGLGANRRARLPPEGDRITDTEWNDWMVGLYDGELISSPSPEIPFTQNLNGPIKKVAKNQLKRSL